MNPNAKVATSTRSCPSSAGARRLPIAQKCARKKTRDTISETAPLPRKKNWIKKWIWRWPPTAWRAEWGFPTSAILASWTAAFSVCPTPCHLPSISSGATMKIKSTRLMCWEQKESWPNPMQSSSRACGVSQSQLSRPTTWKELSARSTPCFQDTPSMTRRSSFPSSPMACTRIWIEFRKSHTLIQWRALGGRIPS